LPFDQFIITKALKRTYSIACSGVTQRTFDWCLFCWKTHCPWY